MKIAALYDIHGNLPALYDFRRTTYDGEAAAQEVRASGNPQALEFAEENVLRVPTAAEAIALFESMADRQLQGK